MSEFKEVFLSKRKKKQCYCSDANNFFGHDILMCPSIQEEPT